MVKLGMSFIDKLEDIDLKLKLIQTLKEVTDKKIYLEVELTNLECKKTYVFLRWNTLGSL